MVLGCMAWGCREAPTQLGPKPNGPSESPPSITTIPARDTTVDSIGSLQILVNVHSQNRIDTVTVLLSGVSLAYPPNVVNDTVFEAAYTVSLGALHHAPFSFRVEANDVLGHDRLTDSVNVRLK